jgi:hypothetical protein
MARGPVPHLLAELSTGVAMRSSALDLASLSRWAPALPRVTWLRAMSPQEESSGAVTCSSALNLASLSRWATVLSRTPRPQRAVDHKNKEGSNCPRHTAGLACVQSMVACYRGACKACGHAATVRFNSATQSQLITLGHGYSGDTTRQDGTTALTMSNTAG